MATEIVVSIFEVKVGGSSLKPALRDSLNDIEVQNDLYLPDVATMRFHLSPLEDAGLDQDVEAVSKALPIGKDVEISERKVGESEANVIFKGEVTSFSIDYKSILDESPMVAVVQAHDKSHRMHRTKKTKTYLNKSASDIAKGIAGDHGLTPKVDSTSQVYEHLFQANITDSQFLKQLGDRENCEVYVSQGELHFKKHASSSDSAGELNWGQELMQFRVRSTGAFQVSEVEVGGWDVMKKAPITGSATSFKVPYKLEKGKSGPDISKAAFGKSMVKIVDVPVATQSEADTLAKSLADQSARDHLYAEGLVAEGMGQILPGKSVTIKGVGSTFDGKYFVTSTTHQFSGDGGYRTAFEAGSRRPGTLLEAAGGGLSSSVTHGFNGVVVGLVTNNNDSEKGLGRVKVKFPWLDDNEESHWARIATPDAGPGRGMMWLPEVNDEVLVAFEHGDINRPYVLGGLWNGKDEMPVPLSDAVGSDGVVNQRIIKSRSGHVIILDDTQGKESITIRDKSEKNEIVIDSAKNTIFLKVDDAINVEAKGKITFKSAMDDFIIECKNFKVNAQQNSEIKANAKILVQSAGQLQMKGMQATLEGTVKAEVKGAMVGVVGQALTEIKGLIVKIN
ncbi:MAG: VgrG-related protein [Chloroflexi bacterium]|nr:VgrG-related protein [Chloroflexota bacterium]